MLAKPQLYATSQQSSKFNGFVFWKMFLNSIVHSFMIFFLTYACYSDLDWGAGDGFGGPSGGIASETLDPQGHTGGYLYIGEV
jgi:magnesium-transporting ATPase (P-type)